MGAISGGGACGEVGVLGLGMLLGLGVGGGGKKGLGVAPASPRAVTAPHDGRSFASSSIWGKTRRV